MERIFDANYVNIVYCLLAARIPKVTCPQDKKEVELR